MTPPVASTADPTLLQSPEATDDGLTYRRCAWCHCATKAGCLLCPVCGSADLAAAKSVGTGTVQRLLRPTRRGLHPDRPYLITLDEGFTVQASIAGGLPGAVPIGSRVRLETADKDARVLAFRITPRG